MVVTHELGRGICIKVRITLGRDKTTDRAFERSVRKKKQETRSGIYFIYLINPKHNLHIFPLKHLKVTGFWGDTMVALCGEDGEKKFDHFTDRRNREWIKHMVTSKTSGSVCEMPKKNQQIIGKHQSTSTLAWHQYDYPPPPPCKRPRGPFRILIWPFLGKKYDSPSTGGLETPRCTYLLVYLLRSLSEIKHRTSLSISKKNTLWKQT